MKSFFAPFAVVAALASAVSAQTFVINSLLNVVVCQPSLITWSGGTPPYFLSILPGGQPSASPLVDLGQQSGTQVTWQANLAVGTSAFLNLRDNTGALAQSGTFTILAGTNTTCVGQPVSTSGGGSAASTPAATSGGTTTSPAVTTGASTTGTTSAGSKTTATTSGSGTTAKPTTSSAASSKYAAAGAAVMIGSAILGLAL